MIADGEVVDATDILYALVKYQGVNNGQNFINSMKVASPSKDYDLIKGRNFTCNQGNVSVEFNQLNGYTLCQTNFCDTFATTGCITGLTPTQYIGCTVATSSSSYICVCTVGTLAIVSNATNQNSNSAYFLDNRILADSYTFCAKLCAGTGPGSSMGSSLLVQFGGNTIRTCSVGGNKEAVFTLAKYHFCKVSGTDSCYEYFLNDVSQCCVCANPAVTCAIRLYACANTGNCELPRSHVCLTTPYQVTYTNPAKIRTSCFAFPETPAYVLLTVQDNNSSTGVIRYDLVCDTTNAVICSGLTPNNPVNVSALNKTAYKVNIYNCCICSNCVTGPPIIQGFAITEVSSCPQTAI